VSALFEQISIDLKRTRLVVVERVLADPLFSRASTDFADDLLLVAVTLGHLAKVRPRPAVFFSSSISSSCLLEGSELRRTSAFGMASRSPS